MKFRFTVLFLHYIFYGIQLINLAYAEPLRGSEVTSVKQKDLKKSKLSSVVSISFKDNQWPEEYNHICTGVLVTNKFVLTAAHCFMGKLWGEVQIIAGSVDLRQGIKYYPEKWITYDRWAEIRNESTAFSSNDIAIIKLSKKVKCSVAMPASLGTKRNDELIGEDVVLVGWGKTKETSILSSQYLNRVDIEVAYNIDCENFVLQLTNRSAFIPDQYFCTKGYPYALLGLGDSGGPVFRKNVVVGINAGVCPFNYTCDWSRDNIDEYKINLHVVIYPYRKFIYDVLKNSDSLIV